MNFADWAIKYRAITQFTVLLLIASGIMAYMEMGKLEDPEFVVKRALVVTQYAGASPSQVEKEVTDVLETAVQRISTLKHVSSVSQRGLSVLYVDIEDRIRNTEELQQIWDELRKRVADASASLPQGASTPIVQDDFGDVFGVFLAVVGDGYSYAELKDWVDFLQRELLLVKNVARVELWGEQKDCVYVDISSAALAELGIEPGLVFKALQSHNAVVPAGSASVGRERMAFRVGGEFETVESIGNLLVQGHLNSNIYLRDIATITRGYVEPPLRLMRYNGMPALGIGVSTVKGGNVIEMGEAVKARIAELQSQTPVGIELFPISYQSDTVQKSITEFMINLLEAVVIVVVLLLLCMGLRSGLLIGAGLLLTMFATFGVMHLFNIDLQRVSLGSLIIALGMLVDNSIVVVEGMLIKLQRGLSRLEAARRTVQETALPLLGATLVAALAFLPVFVARDNTGEYCRSLFLVVSLSLLLSWVLAMTVTPLWNYLFLKVTPLDEGGDPYAGKMFCVYRAFLERSLRHRTLSLLSMVLLLASAIYCFQFVDRSFFPPSRRAQIMVDYWLPEGSSVQALSKDVAKLEKKLLENTHITAVSSFMGSGSLRFYLPIEPEFLNPSYAQLLVNVDNSDNLQAVYAYAGEVVKDYPYADPRVRTFVIGPDPGFKIQLRFRGADADILHALAEEAQRIMRADSQTTSVQDDWRKPVHVIDVNYDQARGQRTGLSRGDVGDALRRGYDFLPVAMYREGTRQMPVLLRSMDAQRGNIGSVDSLEVSSLMRADTVPLGQIAPKVELAWEEPIIRRYDHARTIKVKCDVVSGVAAETVRQRLKPALEGIVLPDGYSMEWGGEYESSRDSQKEVLNGVPLSFLLMAFVVVALFNAFRQPLIIACVLPLSFIGVAFGLWASGQSFGFLALLGALSLAGMLIKNAVILIDQIDSDLKDGKEAYHAVVEASVSRIRPVLMAALSTALGMTPLVLDKFWVSMAVSIIAGLCFATVLTLFVVPILYTVFFRIAIPHKKAHKKDCATL